METRFVPDAPGAWLVYDLGTVVLAVPPALRAVAEAVAATGRSGVDALLTALPRAGVAAGTPFAVLETTGAGLRVALRGPATLAADAETLTGLEAEPWLDRTVGDVAVARLTVPGGEWTFVLTERAAAPAGPAVPTSASAAPPPPAPPPPAPPAPPPGPAVVPPPPLLGPAVELEPRHEITAVPDEVAEDSAPREDAAAPEDGAAPEPEPAIGEHDGHTVLADDLPPRPAADASPGEDRTVVVDEIARMRASRGLADPVPPSRPAPPPGPALSLELPDGSREPLDRVVLLGRAPTPPADGLARIVRLPDGDISRNHARVAVEGGTVVVTDLGSRNGTVVRIPGRTAQKLRGGEPTPVLVGTVIDFGGGVELRVREG